MKKIPDKPAVNRQKVKVSEHNLLIADGQSKKLADIRKKLQPASPVEAKQRDMQEKQLLTGLKPEVEAELNKARLLIDQRINEIMHSFPEGKRNRLFSFRFGSVDAVKTMSIKAAFKTLGIDDNLPNIKSIAEMDFYGNNAKER